MKLLSSSRSISSSCSSSVSLDQNMRTQKSSTASWLAGVFRRILCSRALPTHPSDHISEQNSESCEKNQVMEKIEEIDNAPIVARLMGLDTIPDTNSSSISRSRSVKSTYSDEQDSAPKQGKKHQNLNPKLSVINMPVFIDLENEDFIVLGFGKKKSRKRVGLKDQNRILRSGDLKQRNTREYRRNRTDRSFVEAKVKSKKKRNLEFDDNSEDSSPVSVLDFDQFIVAQETPKTEPETEDSNLENNARRSPINDENLVGTSSTRENTGERAYGLRERDCWRGTESEEAICRLIEEEVKESSWFSSKRFDIEVVAADCGRAVLDRLLDEILLQYP